MRKQLRRAIYRILAGICGLCCAAIPVSWWFHRARQPRRARIWVWIHAVSYRMSERAAGRLLDGREHNEVPW